MITPREALPFDRVVIVADPLDEGSQDSPTHLRRDLEMADETTIKSVLIAVRDLGLEAVRYFGPADLSANAARHRRDVVLPLYGGQRSRSRLSLIPAVCEVNSLHHIGPDAYGGIICQDKDISKNLAKECGLRTPWHLMIRSPEQLSMIRNLPTPFVVKPLLEGSSIGITQRNLIYDLDEGRHLANEILALFGQPVIVEGFARGREVSYNRIEGSDEYWSFSEVYVAGDDDYFDSHLFDADEKLNRRLPRSVRNIDSSLGTDDRIAIERFLAAVGPVGYCRVDGKMFDGRFEFIEITPDAWLAPSGAFSRGFTEKNWGYSDIILAILLSAFPAPRDR